MVCCSHSPAPSPSPTYIVRYGGVEKTLGGGLVGRRIVKRWCWLVTGCL